MSKLNQKRVAALPAQRYDCTVISVKALPGGKFADAGHFNVSDIRDAKDAADRLQREFDDDCDPIRTYVYRKGEPWPTYAGLQMKEYGGYRG